VLHKRQRISRRTRTAWAKTCYLFLAVSGIALKDGFRIPGALQTKKSGRGWWWVLISWSYRSSSILFLFAQFLHSGSDSVQRVFMFLFFFFFLIMSRLLLFLLTIMALVLAQDRPSGVGPAVMGTPSTALTTAAPTTGSTRTTLSTDSSTNATKTSSSTGGATHTIKVGPRGNPHQYVPHSVNATVGDFIVFEFYPRNHSVVQAKYLEPCVPAAKDIFYSGPFNSFNEDDGFLDGPVSICLCFVHTVSNH